MPTKQELDNWVQDIEASYPRDKVVDLNFAVYSFDELALLKIGDCSIKGIEAAIRIWAVVEKVRRDGFPKDLWM